MTPETRQKLFDELMDGWRTLPVENALSLQDILDRLLDEIDERDEIIDSLQTLSKQSNILREHNERQISELAQELRRFTAAIEALVRDYHEEMTGLFTVLNEGGRVLLDGGNGSVPRNAVVEWYGRLFAAFNDILNPAAPASQAPASGKFTAAGETPASLLPVKTN